MKHCLNCVHLDVQGQNLTLNSEDTGLCRLKAPVGGTGWPRVSMADWCAEGWAKKEPNPVLFVQALEATLNGLNWRGLSSGDVRRVAQVLVSYARAVDDAWEIPSTFYAEIDLALQYLCDRLEQPNGAELCFSFIKDDMLRKEFAKGMELLKQETDRQDAERAVCGDVKVLIHRW